MPDPIVKIDGVTVEAKPGTLDISMSIGERAALSVTVISVDGSYRPVTGKDIELFEAASKIWAGSVDEVEELSITEAEPTARYYRILGVSWEQYLDKRFCYDISTGRPLRYSRNFEYSVDPSTDVLTTTTAHGRTNGDRVRVKCHANGTLPGGLDAETEYYVINATTYTLKLSLTSGGSAVNITSAGTLDQILITYRAGEIFKQILIDAATSEPLGTSNIADGAVIDTIIFPPSMSCSEAAKILAEASGMQWWINEEREVYMQARTFTTAPFNLTDSSANYRAFSMRTTREDKCNSVLMQIGMEQVGYEEETFAGDGSTTRWTLAFPVGQMVKIELNGEDKEFAEWLTDSDRAYYFETGGDVIRQDSDEAVLTTADTLRVLYRKFGADTIYEEDSADIATTATLEGGSGIYTLPFERAGIGQVQASAEGRALVAARKANAVEVSYQTDQVVASTCYQLRPGQLQTIENSYFGLSSTTFLIREVSIRDVMGQWLQFGVKGVTTRLIGTAEYWKSMGGGAGGGGALTIGSTATSGTGGGSTSVEYVLTANTTIASPYTPTSADWLTVYVTQGAGPYTISFDSTFNAGVNTNITPVNGKTTVFTFRGRSDGLWWPVASAWIES